MLVIQLWLHWPKLLCTLHATHIAEERQQQVKQSLQCLCASQTVTCLIKFKAVRCMVVSMVGTVLLVLEPRYSNAAVFQKAESMHSLLRHVRSCNIFCIPANNAHMAHLLLACEAVVRGDISAALRRRSLSWVGVEYLACGGVSDILAANCTRCGRDSTQTVR